MKKWIYEFIWGKGSWLKDGKDKPKQFTPPLLNDKGKYMSVMDLKMGRFSKERWTGTGFEHHKFEL